MYHPTDIKLSPPQPPPPAGVSYYPLHRPSIPRLSAPSVGFVLVARGLSAPSGQGVAIALASALPCQPFA